MYRNEKSLAELEEKLAPLAEAMKNLFVHTTDAVKNMNESMSRWMDKSSMAFHSARSVASLIESQAKRMTVKMWAMILIVGCLSSPLTVTAYSLWQNRLTEEKQQAQEWKKFVGNYEKLSNFQKSMLQKMFGGWQPRR